MSVFEKVSELYASNTPDGSDNRTIVTNAYEQLLGYPDAETMGNAEARIGYWENQLESGNVTLENFAGTFLTAANTTPGNHVNAQAFANNQAVVAGHEEVYDEAEQQGTEPAVDDFVTKAATTRAEQPAEDDGETGGGDTGDGETGGGDTGDGETGGAQTVQVTEGGTEDASAADVTFEISDGDYDLAVSSFDVGDTLDFSDVAGADTEAVFNVLTDADQADGEQVVSAANPDSGATVTVTLSGLTADQDGSVFNQLSFTGTFGDESLVT